MSKSNDISEVNKAVHELKHVRAHLRFKLDELERRFEHVVKGNMDGKRDSAVSRMQGQNMAWHYTLGQVSAAIRRLEKAYSTNWDIRACDYPINSVLQTCDDGAYKAGYEQCKRDVMQLLPDTGKHQAQSGEPVEQLELDVQTPGNKHSDLSDFKPRAWADVDRDLEDAQNKVAALVTADDPLTKHEVYEWASEFYLTENLPDNWQELPRSQLYDWVASNAWEPFEDWNPVELWAQVEALAETAISRFNLEVVDYVEN